MSCADKDTTPLFASDAMKVCVRIRPMTAEEIRDGESVVVLPGKGRLQLTPPHSEERTGPSAAFAARTAQDRQLAAKEGKIISWEFDWCLGPETTQAELYDILGEPVMRDFANGFNGCVFAYGQAASGKSHSVFGSMHGVNQGLLPRIAQGLFTAIRVDYDKEVGLGDSANLGLDGGDGRNLVKLSYIEIYNEQVRDLLCPTQEKGKRDIEKKPPKVLEVRQHPNFGVFIPDLTECVVQSVEDVMRLLDFGHKIRVVARTNMNAGSSRSHAIVILRLERQIFSGQQSQPAFRRRSKLSAVDLAGCQRQTAITGCEGREKESREINKSLSALSLIISQLEQFHKSGNPAASVAHIPCRTSKLTHLLFDSMMGNCRTAMLACASPASGSSFLTEATLRVAASVKLIRTRPVKNEEALGGLVSLLRNDIESLKQQLKAAKKSGVALNSAALSGQLAATRKLEEGLSTPWQKQRTNSVAHDVERAKVLQSLGLATEKYVWGAGGSTNGSEDEQTSDGDPYLVNVCDDALLSGRLRYVLPEGEEIGVGSSESCSIRLEGLGIQPVMCTLVSLSGGEVVQFDRLGGSAEDVKNSPCCLPPANGRAPNGAHNGFPDSSEGKRGSLPSEHVWLKGEERLQEDDFAVDGAAGEAEAFAPQAVVHQAPASNAAVAYYPGQTQGRKSSLFKTMAGPAQVSVNGQLSLPKQLLHHRDNLRVGRTHRFQLFIPKAPSTGMRSSMDGRIETLAKQHVNDQDLVKEFASYLEERMGRDRVEDIFGTLQDLQPLIDEANDITHELRGSEADELMFKTHILADVLGNQHLDLLVALRVASRCADGAQQQQQQHARTSHLAAIWSLDKFKRRLELLRDLYQEVSERESMPWTEGVDPNPWEDPSDDVVLPAVSSVVHVLQAPAPTVPPPVLATGDARAFAGKPSESCWVEPLAGSEVIGVEARACSPIGLTLPPRARIEEADGLLPADSAPLPDGQAPELSELHRALQLRDGRDQELIKLVEVLHDKLQDSLNTSMALSHDDGLSPPLSPILPITSSPNEEKISRVADLSQVTARGGRGSFSPRNTGVPENLAARRGLRVAPRQSGLQLTQRRSSAGASAASSSQTIRRGGEQPARRSLLTDEARESSKPPSYAERTRGL